MSRLDELTGRTSRRALLAGTLGAAALAGCARRPAPYVRTPMTTAVLAGEKPFYIAHRGGGDNWPEMTAYAYEQAAKLSTVQALEVSVCRSSDGVLVCSHDPTTERMTGVPYVIANETWKTLSRLMVSAKETLDPRQPARPFSRFDDIVDLYIDNFVMFVEPKTADSVHDLMAKMISLQQPGRVVWKQPINQPHFQEAKKAGFTTWGYVLNEPGHLGANLQRYAAAAEIDLLGAQSSQTNSLISTVSSAASRNGKATIMWPIHNVADRTRGLHLGCEGMMTSNIAEVPNIPL